MKIIDGICYADNYEEVLKASSVSVLDDYKLKIRFSNNETKIFNFKPYLKYPVYEHLKNIELFKNCYIDYGVVTWDENTDIATDTLYYK